MPNWEWIYDEESQGFNQGNAARPAAAPNYGAPAGMQWDFPDWYSPGDVQNVIGKYGGNAGDLSQYLSPLPETPAAMPQQMMPRRGGGGYAGAGMGGGYGYGAAQYPPMGGGGMGIFGQFGSPVSTPYAAVAGQGMGLTPTMQQSDEESRLQRAVEAYLRMVGMGAMAKRWY